MIKLKDILKEVQETPFKIGDQVKYKNSTWTITQVLPGQPNFYFIKNSGGLVVPHVQEKELTLLTAS